MDPMKLSPSDIAKMVSAETAAQALAHKFFRAASEGRYTIVDLIGAASAQITVAFQNVPEVERALMFETWIGNMRSMILGGSQTQVVPLSQVVKAPKL